MEPSNMAYDRAITIFSPDGRLLQVEYARESVKKGTTTVGVRFKDGVVLIVDKRITSRLVEPISIEKIFQIDECIGCATSGLVADARVIVERSRIDALINKIRYDEKIQIKTLVKRICDFKHAYTQYAWVRPFGTAFLIAGVDETGAHLFTTDSSGAFMEYKAGSEGKGRSGAMVYFEDHYKEDMMLEEAIDIGIRAIHKGNEGRLNPDAVEIAVVDVKEKFRKLSHDESKEYVKKAIG